MFNYALDYGFPKNYSLHDIVQYICTGKSQQSFLIGDRG